MKKSELESMGTHDPNLPILVKTSPTLCEDMNWSFVNMVVSVLPILHMLYHYRYDIQHVVESEDLVRLIEIALEGILT